MTSIQGFIDGILDLDGRGKDMLAATVTSNDFGASLDQDCKKHHLQVLLELLPGLKLTQMQWQIIKNTLDFGIKGMLSWSQAAQAIKGCTFVVQPDFSHFSLYEKYMMIF